MSFNGLSLSRRGWLASGMALIAAPAFARQDAAAQLYSASLVIDGNSIADPPFEDKGIKPATAARIRASGVSALKMTLGGTSANLAEAQKEIADTKAAIARNSAVLAQITEARGIAAASGRARSA